MTVAAHPVGETRSAAAGEPAVVDFVALLKPRVVGLVTFTGLIGLMIAPGDMHPVLAATAILCIAVGAGAAGAFNMWYERDIDALMRRTRDRPLPAGRLEPEPAIAFAIALALGAVGIMALATNLVAAALLAGSILFYTLVYTVWLKRRTPQNVVIGGAAGAFPPLIGWAAVTGTVDLMPLVLFAIIFLWTPPHFWALALYRSEDYARAGVPMLPVVAGAAATRRHILGYAVLLVAVSLVPGALGAGALYVTGAAVLGALFVLGAARVALTRDDDGPARQLFGFSIVYLAMLFSLVLIDGGVA
ncbi:MAG: protoheme IX farnesyltransferase [Alphaproteobacteria bacterium]|nr:protoheme IX farnesyltransferase [Alphaproteobacteria bacterium]